MDRGRENSILPGARVCHRDNWLFLFSRSIPQGESNNDVKTKEMPERTATRKRVRGNVLEHQAVLRFFFIAKSPAAGRWLLLLFVLYAQSVQSRHHLDYSYTYD